MGNRIKINGPACDKIRKSLNVRLEYLKKHGLEASLGRMTWSPDGYVSCKLTISEVREDGLSVREASYFEQTAAYAGIDPKALGQTFVHDGVIHRIVGWNSRARRMPIMTETSTGRNYKWTVKFIKEKFPSGQDI